MQDFKTPQSRKYLLHKNPWISYESKDFVNVWNRDFVIYKRNQILPQKYSRKHKSRKLFYTLSDLEYHENETLRSKTKKARYSSSMKR